MSPSSATSSVRSSREQTLINADNAEENLTPTANLADFECDNLFDRVTGPVS